MITIGVDPSINSTGVCVNENGKFTYYIISSKMTKKMTSFHHDRITLLPYEKGTSGLTDYSERESVKTNNIYNIYKNLESIIDKHHPDKIQMEGVSYGSTGSAALVDLSGLNFVLRLLFINKGVEYKIVSPTQNKKFATGNGQAEKDVMIDSWMRLDPEMKDVDIKVDDLADAYFLSCYQD